MNELQTRGGMLVFQPIRAVNHTDVLLCVTVYYLYV